MWPFNKSWWPANGQRKRKIILLNFKDIAFSIDIQTNLKEVVFLDVILNVQNALIVHTRNLTTTYIIKQLSNSISERLPKSSSNQNMFNTLTVEYEDPKSDYKVDLKCPNSKLGKPKTRKKNIIWFTQAFSKPLPTNVAKTFLQSVIKYFPRTNKLHKIFNRNKVKVRYSSMNNMSKIIKGHNKKVTLKPREPKTKMQLQKNFCKMERNYQINDVAYKCDLAIPLLKKSWTCSGMRMEEPLL